MTCRSRRKRPTTTWTDYETAAARCSCHQCSDFPGFRRPVPAYAMDSFMGIDASRDRAATVCRTVVRDRADRYCVAGGSCRYRWRADRDGRQGVGSRGVVVGPGDDGLAARVAYARVDGL